VVIHYEEALYQVYAPLPLPYKVEFDAFRLGRRSTKSNSTFSLVCTGCKSHWRREITTKCRLVLAESYAIHPSCGSVSLRLCQQDNENSCRRIPMKLRGTGNFCGSDPDRIPNPGYGLVYSDSVTLWY